MMGKSILITLFFFVFSFSIIELVLSFYQVSSSGSDVSEQLGEITKDICSLSAYSPLKVVFTDGDISLYIQCGWEIRNSAQRIIVYFATIANIIGMIVTILQRKSLEYLIVSAITLLCGVAGYYSSIYDAMKIYGTKKSCENNLTKISPPENIEGECDFKYFYLNICLGFIAATLIIATGICALRIRSKVFNNKGNDGPQFFESKKTNKNLNDEDYNKFSQKQQQHNDNFFREDQLSNEQNNSGAILTSDPYPSFALKSI